MEKTALKWVQYGRSLQNAERKRALRSGCKQLDIAMEGDPAEKNKTYFFLTRCFLLVIVSRDLLPDET